MQINERGVCIVVPSTYDLIEVEAYPDQSSLKKISKKEMKPIMSFKTKTTTILRFNRQDLIQESYSQGKLLASQ